MKMIYCITALLVFVCSAMAQTLENVGRLVPGKYQVAIRFYMSQKLKDPYSAVYRFDTPYKAMLKDGLLVGGQKHFGWIVPTWVNAKNGFGGYSGEQLYIMFFFEGKLGDATDAFGYGRVKPLP
jgi:hypothetical protein